MTFTAARQYTIPVTFGALAQVQDLKFFYGDDNVINMKMFDAYGNALDMTGSTIEFLIAPRGGVSQVDTPLSGVVSTSSIAVTLDEALAVGDYDYQLRATKSGSSVVLAYGRLQVLDLIS